MSERPSRLLATCWLVLREGCLQSQTQGTCRGTCAQRGLQLGRESYLGATVTGLEGKALTQEGIEGWAQEEGRSWG